MKLLMMHKELVVYETLKFGSYFENACKQRLFIKICCKQLILYNLMIFHLF